MFVWKWSSVVWFTVGSAVTGNHCPGIMSDRVAKDSTRKYYGAQKILIPLADTLLNGFRKDINTDPNDGDLEFCQFNLVLYPCLCCTLSVSASAKQHEISGISEAMV